MNQVTRSAPNSSTEKELIAMAEEELSRLQRQLRIMEDDRMAFSDETSSKLEKQRKIIQQLRQEKAKLCEDITVATCQNQKRKDKKLSKDIYRLLDIYEEYCEKVRIEKEEIVEMDVQIKKVGFCKYYSVGGPTAHREEINGLKISADSGGHPIGPLRPTHRPEKFHPNVDERKSLEADIKNLRPKSSVTENHFQARLTSGHKALQMLKNRLDIMVKKFCGVLASNKELREEINHLLKERNHFNDIWERLLKDINSGKKYMVDLIEQATLAFDQREEWCSKLDALKKRAEIDFVLHSEEMREIQRRLDQYLMLREFLCVKGQKRILKDLEEKERMKKEMQQQELEDQLEVYETTLKKIQTFCQEEDVDRIAALFLKQEEENFALFNYVNELSHEIEALNNVMEEIHEKIDEQIELSKERARQRQATLSSLQTDLEAASKEANEGEKEVQKADENLQKVLNGIEEIFDILGCDRGPILKLLGGNADINIFNVKIYLGTIEKKLSGIITDLYFAERSILSHGKKIKGVASPH